MKSTSITFFLAFVIFPLSALALNVKGKLKSSGSDDLTNYVVVAEQADGEEIVTADVSAGGKFSIKGVSKNFSLSILREQNFLSSVIFAISTNGRKGAKSFKNALKTNLCSDEDAKALKTLRARNKMKFCKRYLQAMDGLPRSRA